MACKRSLMACKRSIMACSHTVHCFQVSEHQQVIRESVETLAELEKQAQLSFLQMHSNLSALTKSKGGARA